MEKTYIVRKLSSGRVSYRIPGKTNSRKFRGDDAKQVVPFEELQECIYDPDIRTLFDKGFLYIESKEARIELGLEFDDGKAASGLAILTKADANKLVFADTFATFKETMPTITPESRELVFEVIIASKKPIDYEKLDFIKSEYGFDIELAKKQKRESEE